MNRLISAVIEYQPEWMNPEDWGEEIQKYGIEGAITPGCPQWNGKNVIWLESYDEDIVQTMLSHNPPAVILANFRMWFDDGDAEILINEKNYTKYDFNKFYKERTGKYDIENPIN